MAGASIDTVLGRLRYGGKKGRAAKRRLNRGWVWTHPQGGRILLRARVPITRAPVDFDVAASDDMALST